MSANYGTAALELAAAGWPVLPLAPNTKLPLLSCPVNRRYKAEGSTLRCDRTCGSREGHGLYDGTTDVEVVAGWWRAHPHALIGARVPDGLVVLDVDPRNGGDDAWTALLADFGPLPPTLTQHTAGGGWHFFFAHPGGRLRREMRHGVDVKAGGRGLVVLAPSARADGRRYEWVDLRPAAHLPRSWATAVRRPERTSSTVFLPTVHGGGSGAAYLEVLCRNVATAVEGTRNETLNRCAYSAGRKVATRELDEQTAHDRLLEAARAAGLDTAGAEGTILSGLNAGRAAA